MKAVVASVFACAFLFSLTAVAQDSTCSQNMDLNKRQMELVKKAIAHGDKDDIQVVIPLEKKQVDHIKKKCTLFKDDSVTLHIRDRRAKIGNEVTKIEIIIERKNGKINTKGLIAE